MSELANKFTLFIESSRILKILVYFLQEHKWRSIIVLSHKPLGGKFSEISRSFISRKPRQCWLSKDNEVGIIWSKCQEKSIKWTPSRSKNRCLLCKGVRCKEDFHEVQPLLFQWIWLTGTITTSYNTYTDPCSRVIERWQGKPTNMRKRMQLSFIWTICFFYKQHFYKQHKAQIG